jgi:hypothetical protein
MPLRKKYKILKKVKEHHKKKAKEAKKAGTNKKAKVEKDPGIPNAWPFKEQELAALEARRARAVEELEQKKQAKKERVRYCTLCTLHSLWTLVFVPFRRRRSTQHLTRCLMNIHSLSSLQLTSIVANVCVVLVAGSEEKARTT